MPGVLRSRSLRPDRGFGDHGRLSLHWDVPLAGRFNWTAGPIIAGDTIVVAGTTGGAGDAV